MSGKFVLIGGGSYGWTPILAKDLFLREGLKNSTLSLVDIDPDAAALLQRYCTVLAERVGTGWTVVVEDLETALNGAERVCVSISTGGLEPMHRDYTIPEEYGVYHTVGDTTGPAGISRTLRNVPIFIDIARKMEKICPHAWMVHVTNPLNQLTRAVTRETSVKCIGLCHNFSGTMHFISQFLDVPLEDVDALSLGVNHGSWLMDITVGGRPADLSRFTKKNYLAFEAQRKGVLKTGTTDDMINEMLGVNTTLEYFLSFELFERFGYFPVGSAPHVAENYPAYLNDPELMKKLFIRRKGVLPRRQEGKEEAKRKIVEKLENPAEADWGKMVPSREGLSVVAEALHTGRPDRVMATMPNRGQVSNLPGAVSVETWASISRGGISPILAGALPGPIAAMLEPVVQEMELSVEAALEGSRRKVEEALYLSPMLHRKDKAAELADKLLAANREFLPQFR